MLIHAIIMLFEYVSILFLHHDVMSSLIEEWLKLKDKTNNGVGRILVLKLFKQVLDIIDNNRVVLSVWNRSTLTILVFSIVELAEQKNYEKAHYLKQLKSLEMFDWNTLNDHKHLQSLYHVPFYYVL